MQVNYKEWYLVEVYSRIVGPLGADRAANALLEIREHVEEAESEYIARGLDPQLATRAAIDQVGRPSNLAKSFVQSGSSREAGTWSALCFLGVLLGGPMLSVIRYGIGDGMGFLLLLCLPAIAAVRTKRPISFGLTAFAGFLVFLFLLVNNSRQVNVSHRGTTSYDHAHRGYFALKKEHAEMQVVEAKIAARLRDVVANEKAIPTAKVSVPGARYRSRGANTWFDRNGNVVYMSDVKGDVWSRFSTIPYPTQRVVPIAKLKEHARWELDQIAYAQSGRTRLMRQYEAALNTSRIERATMHLPSELLFSGMCALAAWGSSFLIATGLVRAITRRRRLVV
jgi:hypothetical protein